LGRYSKFILRDAEFPQLDIIVAMDLMQIDIQKARKIRSYVDALRAVFKGVPEDDNLQPLLIEE
jgi:hypothetical protein